ncbi:MAG TPA: radical SAM protein [Anaeromyxobacteraceae bacterium]|nr:radical SAM protein [Anaeromyxobacteraceae bacterium]
MEHVAPTLERGAIRKDRGGRQAWALVYANRWAVGMANLGVHAVYRLLNEPADVLCERAFLPEGPGEPRTIESDRPLSGFDVIAFSLSFEEDYVRIPEILARAGLPVRASARDSRHPLVVAGGIAVQINPEPIAPFFDAMLVGEAEPLLPPFVDLLRGAREAAPARRELLDAMARLAGVYVPSRYEVTYAPTRGAPQGEPWVTRFEPLGGAPARVRRQWAPDLREVATARVVETPSARFGDLHLVEVARGCLWGCRFCAAGFVQRPYREVSEAVLRAEAEKGLARGQRIGLVGPDTSDHSALRPLAAWIAERGGAASPSSLRVDALDRELARRLAEGGERTVTLAPEAGTARLRRVLNKDFPDDRVVEAAEAALSEGLEDVKLYFMCGLPTERAEDVEGIAALSRRVRDEVLLPWARRRGRMGHMTLSVNPFIPKPWTPFQWDGIAAEAALKATRKLLERELRPLGVTVDVLSPREARLQAVLSRGDRRTADLIEAAWRDHGGALGRALKGWGEDADWFAERQVGEQERLPWDFLDHGVDKAWLLSERVRGLAGKVTRPCAPDVCRACGLDCADRPELRRDAERVR